MPVKRINASRLDDSGLVFSKYSHVGAGTALDINDQFRQLHDMAYRKCLSKQEQELMVSDGGGNFY